MNGQPLSKYSSSFGISLLVTSVLTALLVLLKEKIPPVMAWMKSLTGHHWMTHGLLTLLVFVVLGLALAGRSEISANRLAWGVVAVTVVSGLIIAGFMQAVM